MKIFNHSNAKTRTEPVTNFSPSQTIPNQCLSIKEILNRHAKGMPLSGNRIPIYQGDNEIQVNLDDYRKMDITERYELIENTRMRIAQLRESLQKQNESLSRQQNTNSSLKIEENA